jgi:hypothetical protein
MIRFVRLILKSLHSRWTIAAVVTGVLFLLFVVEGQLSHMPFVAAVVVVLFGALLIVSRRFAFSGYASLALVCLTTLLSVAKYRGNGFDLHVYDLAFTGTDYEALTFLLHEYAILAGPAIMFTVVGLAIMVLIWRNEPRAQVSLARGTAVLAVGVVLLPLTYPVPSNTPRHFFYLSGFNASSFYISILDLLEGIGDTPRTAMLTDMPETEPFAAQTECSKSQARPDIYVVLSESATDFRSYPQISGAALPNDVFRSQDGRVRALRVETFGGGTWVTNLSLMTGLASRDFGWRAPYLTVQLEGRVGGSVSSNLKDCGYRTAVVMPMKHEFVNEGPFLESIGFDTIIDHDAIGASIYSHRDDVYFGAAEKLIDAHVADDRRPLFLEVQTMFGHSPYSETREPQIQLQATPSSDNPELNEYVRRVLIGQQDFLAFLERRKLAHPDRPFVVLEFGDHQALPLKPLADALSGGASLADPDSVAYQSYYSVRSFKSELNMVPFDFESLDIGFLGVSLLEAAGTPLSPMLEDLARLRDHCDGKFSDCKDRAAVDRHLARRINSGLLTLPGT